MVGCRSGSSCPYGHVQPKAEVSSSSQKHDHQPTGDAGSSAIERHSHQPRQTDPKPAPSAKPVSQLQKTNPREFQLGQVSKRFSPIRKEIDDATVLSFTLSPSDPDFPFELAGLLCSLTIPRSYPQNGKLAIRVTNPEIPRGYQINVEKGFDSLVERSPGKTLLALLNDLDKNLERFLTSEKAQTIKIIPNAQTKITALDPVPEVVPNPTSVALSVAQPLRSWTSQQMTDALAKRHADIRQLEARMGRVPNFSKSSDRTTFNVPVQIPKPGRLPLNLQTLKEVGLTVPNLYNLEPCTVQLKGVSGPEAENVQLSFERHVREVPHLTLMAHINYLIQNIRSMATETVENAASVMKTVAIPQPTVEQPTTTMPEEEAEPSERIMDEDRPHVRIISRPPEWDRSDSGSDSSESYDSDEDTDSEDEDEEDVADRAGTSLPVSLPSTEKGIHLSFPNLELHNVELLILMSLSISVKCLRCKSPLDIHNVKPSDCASTVRTESCPKCTTPFTVSYTPNALHANTIRAGTIEITGCTISDLLPSVFRPTCSSCSTTFPVPPGMISVRGDTPIQVCRVCHAKMTFTIPEVKFLRISHPSASLPLRRRKKENLGISAGTPLPNNGTCAHYRHSYRWFRFGCCGRVYACDRCHDAAEVHVNEHADRMVCGWCSREQRFRAEECGVCGRSVIRQKRARGGFWEGGRGTREKALMSRKEKRKYKRVGGVVPGKKNEGGK